MIPLLRSARAKLMLALAVVLALIVTFPLALGVRLAGLDSMGVSARSLRGSVWWGTAEALDVGGIHLGTVDVFLDPLRLFIGEARIDIARVLSKEDAIVGGMTIGFGRHGLDNVSGALPLAAALAPLPVSRVEFDHFSVRFSGNRCTMARGRVRIGVPDFIHGLNLASGFSGEARCEGDALLLPLVSQSGQARLDAKVLSDGRYDVAVRVSTSDPALAAALGANGFRPVGGEQLLRATGTL